MAKFDAMAFVASKGLNKTTTVKAQTVTVRLSGMPTAFTADAAKKLAAGQTDTVRFTTDRVETPEGITLRAQGVLTPKDAGEFIGKAAAAGKDKGEDAEPTPTAGKVG